MAQYQIAVIIGSLRKDSINRRLANAVIKLAPSDFTFNMPDISGLPLYNQDDDPNPRESVIKFKSDIKSAHGVIFVTPEYNRSIPGVLKNAIDHASRPKPESVWAGKPGGIIGASGGPIGTAMAQQHLRNVLAHLDMRILGQPEAFIQIKDGFYDDTGDINQASKIRLQNWMDKYVSWVIKHVA